MRKSVSVAKDQFSFPMNGNHPSKCVRYGKYVSFFITFIILSASHPIEFNHARKGNYKKNLKKLKLF